MQTYQALACRRLITVYDQQAIACCEGLKQPKKAVTRQKVFDDGSFCNRSHEDPFKKVRSALHI